MKTTKYKATIIGMITSGICVLVSLGFYVVPVLLIIPLLTLFEAIPLEYIAGIIFGESNSPMIFFAVIFSELILFLILCFWYFKKVILDKKQERGFNTKRLIVFFVFLQFIVHPMVFYIWLINYSGDPEDGMIAFYIVNTFPYSGCSFIFLGIIIDLIRNRSMKS